LLDAVIYLLFFVLVALVSGNNLSVCTGSIISSRIVKKSTGIIIGIVGYSIGFVMQGDLLKIGLIAIMPSPSAYLIIIALSIALAMFVVAHIARVPQSLSITFTMIIVGISMAYGKAFSIGYFSNIIEFWILAGAAAGILTVLLMKISYKFTINSKIWGTVERIKALLIIVSFLTAFVLGANTIGFVFASVSGLINESFGIAVAIMAMVFGSVLLSGGELKRIGNEILPMRYLNALISQSISMILVEVGTLLSIPISNTQTFTASLYGAGLSYRTRMLRKKPLFSIIAAWILTALIALILGYSATFIFYHAVL
jgi:PiT family inorganic phosphate transporter